MQPIAEDLTDYQVVEEKNKQTFMEMMRVAMPEFHIVALMMDKLQINPVILFHTMQHLYDIAQDSKYGQVHILIEDGIVRFIKGEHSTKLNEPVDKNRKMMPSDLTSSVIA